VVSEGKAVRCCTFDGEPEYERETQSEVHTQREEGSNRPRHPWNKRIENLTHGCCNWNQNAPNEDPVEEKTGRMGGIVSPKQTKGKERENP